MFPFSGPWSSGGAFCAQPPECADPVRLFLDRPDFRVTPTTVAPLGSPFPSRLLVLLFAPGWPSTLSRRPGVMSPRNSARVPEVPGGRRLRSRRRGTSRLQAPLGPEFRAHSFRRASL